MALMGVLVAASPLASQTPESYPTFVVSRVGQGPPMILIPGLTSPGSAWDTFVAHYHTRYTCHVLTLAGFAGIPPVEAPSLERVRNDLIAYIRDNRLERPIIVGHSIGGMIALWTAATAPELVGPIVSVEGATYVPALFDTAATPEKAARAADGIRRGIANMTAERFAATSDRMLRAQVGDSVARARLAPVAARSDPRTTAEFLAQQQTIDLRDSVRGISVPVLLLVGTAGIAPDARAAYLASARRQVASIRDVRVVEVPSARHFIHLDAPQEMATIVDAFLRGVSTR